MVRGRIIGVAAGVCVLAACAAGGSAAVSPDAPAADPGPAPDAGPPAAADAASDEGAGLPDPGPDPGPSPDGPPGDLPPDDPGPPPAPLLPGAFTDLTGPLLAGGAGPVPVSPGPPPAFPGLAHGLFADLDGDGASEVLLTGTDDPQAPTSKAAFRLEGGALVPVAVDLPAGLPAALLDLDGDALLDAVVAQPPPGPDGPVDGIHWGTPAGGFLPAMPAPAGAPALPSAVRATLGLADVDADGLVDLLAGGDPGRVWLNEGARRFAPHPELFPSLQPLGEHALLAASLAPGELLLVGLGETAFDGAWSFFAPAGLDAAGRPVLEPVVAIPPGVADGVHAPLAPGQPFSDYAPMGAALADLDGDGRLDLGVAVDPSFNLYRSAGAFPLEDRSAASGAHTAAAPSGVPMIPWGAAFLDVDRDGRPDLVRAHGDDAGTWAEAAIGPQHATLHRGVGPFAFEDATAGSGLETPGQWRSLAAGDLDADGAPDLVVGGLGEPAHVYLNTWADPAAAPPYGLALRLRGTTSNAPAVGAHVEVTPAPGAPASHHVVGSRACPGPLSEPLVFVGLGDAPSAWRVRVTWPSGFVQELADLPAGAVHTVVEPPTVTVSPPGRHRKADGKPTAFLDVVARHPDGTPRPDAPIAVSITHGAGAIGPPEPAGDGVRFPVTAPTSPGSTRFEVVIDGEPLAVHPRLWWD